MFDDILNWVVISDLHCGCQLGLCPPQTVHLDEGGTYFPSEIQLKMWGYWLEFWDEWVPAVLKRQRYGVIVNGDILDGIHHGSVHQITQNIAIQKSIAKTVLEPIINGCNGRVYFIRGTEAHVGKSSQTEEELAEELGAVPNSLGQYARYDLWKKIGKGLVHFLHHIGTTSSNAYEATAINKELTEEYNESARWGEIPPNIIIRSHRHRHFKIEIHTHFGIAIAEVTPGWQAKTPFQWRMAGARLAPPQFGGIIIRQGDEELYTRNYVRTIGRSNAE